MRQQREADRVIFNNLHALIADLKLSGLKRDLQWGRRLHAKAVECGNESDSFVVSSLIRMYAKCSRMLDARHVFDSIHKPGISSLTALMLGYAETGEARIALEIFFNMKSYGCLPDSVTYVAALKACTSLMTGSKDDCLKIGRQIHVEIGSFLDHYLQNLLIDMYAKCGSMVEAHAVFDSMQHPDVVSWTTLILGYAEYGEGKVSLDLYSRMKASGCMPDSVTYIAALKACKSLAASGHGTEKKEYSLQQGRAIHSEVGFTLDRYVQGTLIDMYAKCGSMVDARYVFERINKPQVMEWTAMILGYAENGEGHAGVDLFFTMKASGCAPDSVAHIAALKACASLAVNGHRKWDCLQLARKIHSEIHCNLSSNVQCTIIDMYAKCGSMDESRKVFERIQKPEVASWTALILGYAENGKAHEALNLFYKMKASGCVPNSVTFIAALKACICLAMNGDKEGLQHGREIHSEIGCNAGRCVSTVIDMYVKCGSMVEARRVFDSVPNPDVVSWTNLLLGYAENGEGQVSLELFSRMKATGCAPDAITYVAALKACISLAVNGHASEQTDILKLGRSIELEIGCNVVPALQGTLIDMYVKCGSMVNAQRALDSVQNPDVIAWTALLMGYAENGEGYTCLTLFSRMKSRGCVPNPVTYIAVIKACGLIGDSALGRRFHSEISEFTPALVTSLVDFYAKCGSVVEAREVFELHLQTRSVSTWNAMLAGYSSFGDSESVFKLFEAMRDDGLQPNGVTLLCMLLCCSHAGLVDKARDYFEGMPVQFGLSPTLVHYTCLVDVLARTNQLTEAIALLRRMPCNPDAVMWMTLSSACHQKSAELGAMVSESLALY